MQSNTKSERFEARITMEQKHKFQYAANLAGQSITDFVISALQEAATKVIREHEIINLSIADQKKFIHALLDAPKPNDRLIEAKKQFSKKVK